MILGMTGPTRVYLEVGSTRVFAAALDWPGWCRSGRTEELAQEALAAYVPRYATVATRARAAFPRSVADAFDIVERVPGSGATDFGALGKPPAVDAAPVDAKTAKRAAALVAAAWAEFDAVVAGSPAELRKGPRGGGRDRDKMVDHVLGAEASYARMIGVKHKPPAIDDRAAIEALRAAILEVLRVPSDGSPIRERGWPARYAARRVAWHVLDHAWEMQDRSE